MTLRKQRQQGLELTPENIQGGGGTDLSREGEISTDSSDSELKVRLNAATRTIVTEDQTQVLTNKTIDADLNTIVDLEVDNLKSGVLNVSTTLSGASDTQVPSALAVKTYVDNKAAAQNEASEISYDPTASGLAATNVQDAIDEVEGVIESHIQDTTDAHDASAISNTPSGNLAATDVQAALNELQGDADTNASAISNHISDATDAHDATAISVVTISGVTGDDVQEVLEDLKDQIDTKGTGNGDVIGPASSTDNAITRFDSTTGKLLQNSVVTLSDTGVIAGVSIDADTNTITNIENADIKSGAAIDASKIADGSVSNAEFQYIGGLTSDAQTQITSKVNTTGGSIITPARLDMKQDTLANLFTYALTATDGQLVFATDTEETFVVKNNTLSAVGGGSSGLNTIFQLTASEQLTDWSTGDNATFLGGGTLAGTFVKETSTPLNGTASYKYTQAAGSLDDYLASPAQSVPLRFRGQQTFLTFPFQYNGNTSDIRIIIYDVTNTTIISSATDVVIGTNGATSSAIVGVIIPLTCTSIRVGFHVKTLNSGKIFSFDDIQFSTNVTAVSNVANITDFVTDTFTTNWTNTTVIGKWKRVGDTAIVNIRLACTGTPASGTLFINIPSTITIDSSKLANPGTLTNAESLGIATFNVAGTRYVGGVGLNTTTQIMINTHGGGGPVSTTIPGTFANGSYIEMEFIIPVLGWSAYNTSVIVPTQQVTSDTIPFVFKATAIVDTDPIGTFNTYTYAINTNTITISASAPTQTTSSMNTNGIQVFTRAYNAASTTASPARFEIFLGKGLKSNSINIFKNTGKSVVGAMDIQSNSSDVVMRGVNYKDYNETTGILIIDAGFNPAGIETIRQISFSDNTNQTNGYVTFAASKAASIAALPIFAPRIAYLSDIKSSGADGGSASAATTQTRTLNTIVDATGIVTNLSSNQFILPPGVYSFDITATAGGVNSHKARLRNITDSTTSLVGSTEYSPVATQFTQNKSRILGEVAISSSKTFEIQHYTSASRSGDGLGTSVGNGESEVYTQAKITLIRKL